VDADQARVTELLEVVVTWTPVGVLMPPVAATAGTALTAPATGTASATAITTADDVTAATTPEPLRNRIASFGLDVAGRGTSPPECLKVD
jgi:hypothetical protein